MRPGSASWTLKRQPACSELQHSHLQDDAAIGTAATLVYDPRTPRLDSLSDFLLPGELGILVVAQSDAGIGRRELRSLHRIYFDARSLDVRRMLFTRAIDR